MSVAVRIAVAASPADIEAVRALMLEYRASLGLDLEFQGFAAEVSGLPGAYGPPGGILYLATVDGDAAGCVALRRWDATRAELKRLYVRPSGRGHGLGRQLTELALAAARERGYREVLLDTLPTMTTAQQLYLAMGFEEIDAYRENPIAGSKYMSFAL